MDIETRTFVTAILTELQLIRNILLEGQEDELIVEVDPDQRYEPENGNRVSGVFDDLNWSEEPEDDD